MSGQLREVSSILIDADATSVYRALLPDGALAPDGLVTGVPNVRLDIRGHAHDARAARRWFLLRPEGEARTRLIHGAVVPPAGLRTALVTNARRDALREGVETELAAIKRRAEAQPR